MATSQGPEKSFRIGYCQASVFKNVIEPKDEGPKRTVRNVVLQRRYKDKEGKWESANSFGLSDLPSVIRVLELAQQYVESVEAETTS